MQRIQRTHSQALCDLYFLGKKCLSLLVHFSFSFDARQAYLIFMSVAYFTFSIIFPCMIFFGWHFFFLLSLLSFVLPFYLCSFPAFPVYYNTRIHISHLSIFLLSDEAIGKALREQWIDEAVAHIAQKINIGEKLPHFLKIEFTDFYGQIHSNSEPKDVSLGIGSRKCVHALRMRMRLTKRFIFYLIAQYLWQRKFFVCRPNILILDRH